MLSPPFRRSLIFGIKGTALEARGVALLVADLEFFVLRRRAARKVVVLLVTGFDALRRALESACGVRCQSALAVLPPPAAEAATLASSAVTFTS